MRRDGRPSTTMTQYHLQCLWKFRSPFYWGRKAFLPAKRASWNYDLSWIITNDPALSSIEISVRSFNHDHHPIWFIQYLYSLIVTFTVIFRIGTAVSPRKSDERGRQKNSFSTKKRVFLQKNAFFHEKNHFPLKNVFQQKKKEEVQAMWLRNKIKKKQKQRK